MINLLPSQYKDELLTAKTERLIVIIGFLIFIFFLSLFLIILAIEIYLTDQVNVQKSFLELQRKEKGGPEIKEMEEKTKNVNLKLSRLDNFYQGQIHLAEILERINSTLPGGAYLTNFSYSKDTSLISISGFSPTREKLKEFQINLSETFQKKDIKEVDVPMANWIEATNINFAGINFEIN
jgi:Tfp pilus assembly protein PilN